MRQPYQRLLDKSRNSWKAHKTVHRGYGRGPNSGIYDDSVPGEAISVNGRHEGTAIVINNIEIIFDNHHPDGLNREQYMTNLLFHAKLFNDLWI